MKSHTRLVRRGIVLCIASLCFFTTQAFAQTGTPCATPGAMLFQSRESAPIGVMGARSYRLEKHSDKWFCLIVKMDSIVNRDFLVWINDNPRTAYHLRKDAIVASLPLDWLEQGARISVSERKSPYDLASFKERLTLPESVLRLQKQTPAPVLKVSAIRRVYRYAGFKTGIFVEIEITSSTSFIPEVANNSWALQIGRTSFYAGVHHNRLSATMTEEAFAKLKDGDLMRVGFGGAFEAKTFARLDKRILERRITQGLILRQLPDQIEPDPRYLFYLHGYIVEDRNTEPVHPEYGRYQYSMILANFMDGGFVVISEARKKDREIEPYARKVTEQIRQLLKAGVPADHITVVGASQGSWIAMLASTYVANRGVNFVLIAACAADKEFLKTVDLHGNVLSIYERSDVAQSCSDYRADATGIKDWKEVEVNTGLKHGFLYRPLREWLHPTVAWAKGKR